MTTGIVTRKSALRVAVTASAVLAVARYTRWLEPEMLGLSRASSAQVTSASTLARRQAFTRCRCPAWWGRPE